MLTKTIKFLFSQPHLKASDLTARMTELRAELTKQNDQLTYLKSKVKEQSQLNGQKNKILHQKRVRLTEDVKKSEQLWNDAKRISQINKTAAIHNFAHSLVSLGVHFKETIKHQKQGHPIELKQGFDNTVRLFFSTLQKFKITQFEVKEGEKVRGDEMQVVGEEKNQQKKGTVARVEGKGWLADKKVIAKAKVVVYV